MDEQGFFKKRSLYKTADSQKTFVSHGLHKNIGDVLLVFH